MHGKENEKLNMEILRPESDVPSGIKNERWKLKESWKENYYSKSRKDA
jgi:hypothetical protein